jgi:hypothetical protein
MMGLFKKLGKLFSGSGQTGRELMSIAVQCNRCGEVIHSRVNLYNDLSADYADDGGLTYFCRKELIGEGAGEIPCFQRVVVELTFDGNRRLTGREVIGGKFIEGEG